MLGFDGWFLVKKPNHPRKNKPKKNFTLLILFSSLARYQKMQSPHQQNAADAFFRVAGELLSAFQQLFPQCERVAKLMRRFHRMNNMTAKTLLLQQWHAEMKDFYSLCSTFQVEPVLNSQISLIRELDIQTKWTDPVLDAENKQIIVFYICEMNRLCGEYFGEDQSQFAYSQDVLARAQQLSGPANGPTPVPTTVPTPVPESKSGSAPSPQEIFSNLDLAQLPAEMRPMFDAYKPLMENLPPGILNNLANVANDITQEIVAGDLSALFNLQKLTKRVEQSMSSVNPADLNQFQQLAAQNPQLNMVVDENVQRKMFQDLSRTLVQIGMGQDQASATINGSGSELEPGSESESDSDSDSEK